MSLTLPATESARIRSHLLGAYPEEGCGVLLGQDLPGGRRVERAIPIDNRGEGARHNRYVIGPEQFLAAEKQGREAGLDVVGFFHSHPDHPAEPSGFDLEQAWPYYSYLIVSVSRGRVTEMRSWRLAEDRSRFDTEALVLVPPTDADPAADGET